ncbi:hypothetical protein ZIOFF_053499 [Zingiber officinale]|uniref:Geranylgeranyl diphosphate reductase, chloroplastic n=1 Tax=Zingiber officinale TaxID=94328 RepID=A0A8J5FCF9_ZINOF|nr:hypothetical protein ZIOFF_053499 [Zingiber officinale]
MKLIVEAEKVAKTLEMAAPKSSLAQASLMETRMLIAEARRSIGIIEAGTSTCGFDQVCIACPPASTRRRASRTSAHLNGQKLRVAVVGGGPAGGETAETLAKGGVETILIERKLDNCKPCGGAIPLCMVEEFGLPLDLIDRHVTKMKMISPSNVAVDIGRALGPHVYIGMVRCEVLDAYLRGRAAEAGASVIKGLFLRLDLPKVPGGIYRIMYNEYSGGGAGERRMAEVDAVIGADGANSRVAKSIEAGEYEYAIAFQERVKIPEAKMEYYKEPAEMYIGDDVSPNFYRWVFPKCDHVAVGTGTVTHKADIKKFQAARRLRAKDKIEVGTIIRVEAHPIPEHPRPRRYVCFLCPSIANFVILTRSEVPTRETEYSGE